MSCRGAAGRRGIAASAASTGGNTLQRKAGPSRAGAVQHKVEASKAPRALTPKTAAPLCRRAGGRPASGSPCSQARGWQKCLTRRLCARS